MNHLAAVTISVLALSSPAFADETLVVSAPPPKTLGVDAMAILPVGDYGRAAELGLGVLGRLEVPAGSGFLTGRAGVVFHAMDPGVAAALTLIPLYAGYRLPVGQGGAYVVGELGITLAYATVDTALGRMSASDSELGLTLMAGVRRGTLDLRGGLFAPDIGNAIGLGASAGFDFAAF